MKNEVKLEWVNHASYVLRYKDINFIADPWLFGASFDDGWDLLVESKFTIQDFNDITHIWFSHEHPDHFSPPVLSQIPESVRKKITVLFQETSDKRVVNFCKKLSFTVIELAHRKAVSINDDFRITCGKMVGIDSWLLCEINGLKILNLNDCVIDKPQLSESISRTTGSVDILMTQFSYANWIGNPEDKQLRELSAKEKLERVKIQIETFKPEYTIPFASFVYFSHEENKYMNDSINTIEVAHNFINDQTKSKSLVFYPGNNWDFHALHNSDQSLAQYAIIYEKIDSLPYRQPLPPIDEKELIALSKKYLWQIRESNSIVVMKLLQWLPEKFGFKPLIIKLMDTQSYCSFDWSKGLVFLPSPIELIDVELSSRSLQQIFKFQYGVGSVLVNGRYRASAFGSKKLNRVFFLGLWNSIDKKLSFGTLLNKILGKTLGKDIRTEEEYSFCKSWPKSN